MLADFALVLRPPAESQRGPPPIAFLRHRHRVNFVIPVRQREPTREGAVRPQPNRPSRQFYPGVRLGCPIENQLGIDVKPKTAAAWGLNSNGTRYGLESCLGAFKWDPRTRWSGEFQPALRRLTSARHTAARFR